MASESVVSSPSGRAGTVGSPFGGVSGIDSPFIGAVGSPSAGAGVDGLGSGSPRIILGPLRLVLMAADRDFFLRRGGNCSPSREAAGGTERWDCERV